MSTDYSVFELKTAFQQRGCPLCSYEQRLAEQYLRFFLWENVGDAGVRRQMLASLGYCPEHVQLLALTELRMFGGAAAVNIIYLNCGNETIVNLYDQSDELYLNHLQAGLERFAIDYPAASKRLAEDAIRRLEGQRQAMLEFIRKRDWNYRHEKLTPQRLRPGGKP